MSYVKSTWELIKLIKLPSQKNKTIFNINCN